VLEAASSWPAALENLDSMLTQGVDMREATRPMLGIVPEELTAERVARQNIGATRGIYLAGVLPDGSAAMAGLQQGDVIIHIGGMAISDWPSLMTTLGAHRAGDRVQVGYVRGAKSGVVAVDLVTRPGPEVPFDLEQAVERARELRGDLISELRELVTGLSNEQAERRPSSEVWSIKETLAHLSVSERFLQHWCAEIIVGNTRGQDDSNPTVVPELLAMTLSAAPTVDALVDRLEQDMDETHALFAALRSDVVAMKARYRLMASALMDDLHIRDHFQQIRNAVHLPGSC
jgi:hypothetical protein